MKIILRIAQVINIIGLSAFISNLLLKKYLSPTVTEISNIVNGFIIVSSFLVIVICCFKFLKKIDNLKERSSSNLSPLIKFLFPNLVLSVAITFFMMGCFYDVNFFKLLLVWTAFGIIPIIISLRSVYIVVEEKIIRLYDYSDSYFVIDRSSLKKTTKFFFNLVHKVTYIKTEGKIQSVFYFPSGGMFLFSKSSSMKKLEKMIDG